jgi:phage terminase large subunit-like protein
MGRTLFGWQDHYLAGVLATAGGRLVHRESLVSAARQNGKSEGAAALLGWYLEEGPNVLGEPSLALLVSHDLRLTTRIFERVHAVLDKANMVQRARFSFGRQDLLLVNGSELVVQSDTASAGHGYSRVGLLYADEMWAVHDDAWEHGLLPTTRVHPQPIILATSTAGDETSTLLKRWRERGLRAIDTGDPGSFYFAEWSVPANVDPMDPAGWRWANPAMGQPGSGLELATLRHESQSPNRAQFLRASCNLWISAAASWLDPGLWESLAVDDAPPLTGGVLSVEVSQDGSRFVGVRAARVDDHVMVETAFSVDQEPAMWDIVDQALAGDRKLALTVTPGLIQHLPERWGERTKLVGFAEVARWTIPVRAAIQNRQVRHRGDVLLAEHVNRAVLSRTESGQGISSNRSPGPVELCRAMVWAVHLTLTPTVVRAKPSIAFG